jgi:hypothetical protein
MESDPFRGEAVRPYERLGLDALFELRDSIARMAERQAYRIVEGMATEPEDPIHYAVTDKETREYIYERERKIRSSMVQGFADEIEKMAKEVEAEIAHRQNVQEGELLHGI